MNIILAQTLFAMKVFAVLLCVVAVSSAIDSEFNLESNIEILNIIIFFYSQIFGVQDKSE